LAAILQQKWSVYSPYLMGVPIYNSSLLFNTFRRVMEDSESIADCSDGTKYVNTRIWALYIGTLVERGTPTQPAQTTSMPQWFNRRLVEQAWKLHLFTWDGLVKVLTGVLYEDYVLSQGSVWYEELVLIYGLGEEIERYLNNLSPASRSLSRRTMAAWQAEDHPPAYLGIGFGVTDRRPQANLIPCNSHSSLCSIASSFSPSHLHPSHMSRLIRHYFRS
jgi:hypothetical protein